MYLLGSQHSTYIIQGLAMRKAATDMARDPLAQRLRELEYYVFIVASRILDLLYVHALSKAQSS